jgi:2-oxoglutarate ferredoxin oxidoreductase subunit alpha
VVNSQRAGPSTGMPTKTEQSDLFQSVYGRNADSPLAVIASYSPSNCFEMGIEAVRIATTFMTPVILLTDGYLANASEPWLIPDASQFPKFPVSFRTETEGFHPFVRDDDTLARAWAVPGTPGLEHRIGGIEKASDSGNISYDPDNHQRMTDLRAQKIAGIADHIPEQDISVGESGAALAMVGWGSTYGPIREAVIEAREAGLDVAHVHIRYLSPFPRNLGALLGTFGRVIVPEMNNGQLVKMLRSEYLVPAEGMTKVNGKPFKVSELLARIKHELEQA